MLSVCSCTCWPCLLSLEKCLLDPLPTFYLGCYCYLVLMIMYSFMKYFNQSDTEEVVLVVGHSSAIYD